MLGEEEKRGAEEEMGLCALVCVYVCVEMGGEEEKRGVGEEMCACVFVCAYVCVCARVSVCVSVCCVHM